jgi:hypothetical protein
MPRPRKHATDADKYKAYRARKATRIDQKMTIAEEAAQLVAKAKELGIIEPHISDTREGMTRLYEMIGMADPSAWRYEVELKK